MEKKNQIISKVFPDGTLVEMLYDPISEDTHLLVYKDGVYETTSVYTDKKDRKWYPLSADNGLLTTGFVKLPNQVGSYTNIREVYEEIKTFVGKYIELPQDFLAVSSVYVMMTWFYDRFQVIPYLRVIGEYGTGKTRFLESVGSLCYKRMFTGGSISQSAVFRSIDLIRGAFVFDEADFRNSDLWSEIVKILNAGYAKNLPVIRSSMRKGDEFSPQTFNAFGPKILASREKFADDALESRCLTQHLFYSPRIKAPAHLPQSFEAEATNLRNKLLAIRLDRYSDMEADEETLKGIEFPRLKQSALAVTSIAKLVGNDVLEEVLFYLMKYEGQLQTHRKHDVRADVVLCVAYLAERALANSVDNGKPAKIFIGDLTDHFVERFYKDYSDSSDRFDQSKDKLFAPKRQVMPARKMGVHVRALGLAVERGGNGFYIPLPQEKSKIDGLVERYGLKEILKEINRPEEDIKPEEIPF